MPTQHDLFNAAKNNAKLATALQEKHPPLAQATAPVQSPSVNPKTSGG